MTCWGSRDLLSWGEAGEALVVTSILSNFGGVFKSILFGKSLDLCGSCKTLQGCSI